MTNPYLPLPPADGKHIFEGNYRCKRCGVYNRPDVPSEKEKIDAPCEGRWKNSGKMRAYAEDRWAQELAEEAHVHTYVPTKYDQFELRCSDDGCFTSKILPGNPRYCQAHMLGIRHEPHNHQYWYVRYGETERTTGEVWCDG
jgi:hypothetical protein